MKWLRLLKRKLKDWLRERVCDCSEVSAPKPKLEFDFEPPPRPLPSDPLAEMNAMMNVVAAGGDVLSELRRGMQNSGMRNSQPLWPGAPIPSRYMQGPVPDNDLYVIQNEDGSREYIGGRPREEMEPLLGIGQPMSNVPNRDGPSYDALQSLFDLQRDFRRRQERMRVQPVRPIVASELEQQMWDMLRQSFPTMPERPDAEPEPDVLDEEVEVVD